VRLYEEWGFLPPIPRSESGYRLFSQAHLDQMRLARTALHGGWPGKNIRRSAIDLVRQAASGDLGGALEQAYHHLALVQAERAQAEAAAGLLERWAGGIAADATVRLLRIGQAAALLGVTIDMLLPFAFVGGWARNPRSPLLPKPSRIPSRSRQMARVSCGVMLCLALAWMCHPARALRRVSGVPITLHLYTRVV
jgi:DNA-binding transcriptional MerR regulator